MWARRPRTEVEETWAEEAETAAAEEVVEDSYPGPAIPGDGTGAQRVHRPTTPAEDAGIERTEESTTTTGEEI